MPAEAEAMRVDERIVYELREVPPDGLWRVYREGEALPKHHESKVAARIAALKEADERRERARIKGE